MVLLEVATLDLPPAAAGRLAPVPLYNVLAYIREKGLGSNQRAAPHRPSRLEPASCVDTVCLRYGPASTGERRCHRRGSSAPHSPPSRTYQNLMADAFYVERQGT